MTGAATCCTLDSSCKISFAFTQGSYVASSRECFHIGSQEQGRKRKKVCLGKRCDKTKIRTNDRLHFGMYHCAFRENASVTRFYSIWIQHRRYRTIQCGLNHRRRMQRLRLRRACLITSPHLFAQCFYFIFGESISLAQPLDLLLNFSMSGHCESFNEYDL